MSKEAFRFGISRARRPACPRPRQHARRLEAQAHPPDRAHLQLHLGLRRPLRDVQQLEARRSQVRHDARRSSSRSWTHPFWGAVENLNISGGEPTTRNDLPEMVEMFQRHLPRMRKIGINTTGLTPHRAIPMLTRIVKFCAEHDLLDQHPRVARRHRRRPRSGPPRQARLRQGLRDDRGDAGAVAGVRRTSSSASPSTIFATNLEDAQNILDVGADEEARHRVQHAAVHRRHAEQQGARRRRSASTSARKSSCAKFFLDRVQEESVLSGQAFLYLHYADMIANGYQRTMPCPFQTQGLLLNPYGDLHYCENSEAIGNVLDDAGRGALLQGREPGASRARQGRRSARPA